MKFIIPGFIGFYFGVVFSFFITSTTFDPSRGMVNKALADCESSLPRNGHCYIIAVPASKD